MYENQVEKMRSIKISKGKVDELPEKIQKERINSI